MRYDEIRCEFLLNSSWVDLDDYRLQSIPIRGSFGIQGSNPLDRVASTGTLKLTLLNTNNMFTPGHANCMSGFGTGMKFRLRIVYSGRMVTRFYGFVPPDGISIKPSLFVSTTDILVVDYMEHLAAHELDLPAFAADKKIGEVVALILANMPVQPLSTSYGTGKTTFGAVFDTVQDKTRALQEIGKVTLAELGYVYIKQSSTSDEILTVEARLSRNGKALATTNVPDFSEPNVRVVDYDDVFYRLTEQNDRRILQPTLVSTDVVISDDFKGVDFQHAKNYYNRVNAKAYPRRIDTSDVVLFTLENPLQISGNTSVELRGTYKDPDQLAVSVAAYSNVSPAATTDYVMNSAEDGTGTNMTSDLTVTATPGASGIDYVLTNTSLTTGYVILLQARGKGVYSYRPIERIQEDSTLVNTEGVKTLNLDMRYQDGVYEANDFAVTLLNKHKQKLTLPESVTINANRECTPLLACAFATLQVGDKIRLEVSSIGHERDAFVQGMNFEIRAGDVVEYTLLLKDALYDTDEAWILEDATYGLLGATTVLGF